MASTYDTASQPAAILVAGVMSAALLAKERKAREEYQRSLTEWELFWRNPLPPLLSHW